MNTEYECTLLEVNKEELEERLFELGAKKHWENIQKRYTYDFIPKQENKWIRLRTNGITSTLTIKELFDKEIIGGTTELEIEVSDFDKTNLILQQLGYSFKNYQENRRAFYTLDSVEISIDKWPLIPEYAEIEGKTEEDVKKIVELLNLNYKITNLDVTSIYEDIYGIDVLSIKELKF